MANPAESRICGILPALFPACRQAGLFLSGACPDANREANKRKKKRECFRHAKNTIENNCGVLLNTDIV
jgi:hypothetical protein